MNSNSIIVPIALEVLVVPKADYISKLNLSSRLNTRSVLGEHLQFDLNGLFDENDESTIRKGIHLHWKLPKALKHGVADANGEIQFPLVPNRWMIVRYQTNVDDLRAIPSKTWLVKSDQITRKQKNWVVLEETYQEDKVQKDGSTSLKQRYDFKSIGVAAEWGNDYIESDQNAVALTGVGAVNPYFSEIYDDSKSVFGFHDTMDGQMVENNTAYSYVVTGWYSNEEHDPYHPGAKSGLFSKIRQSWKLENADAAIERSIFTANIQSVKWTTHSSTSDNSKKYRIAVGNSTTEALSALLKNLRKDQAKDFPEVEVYLNALQNNLLESDYHSVRKLKIENHKSQFTPKQRGFLWNIRKIEKNKVPNSGDTLPDFPNNPALVVMLKEVNNLQSAYNQKKEELKSLRQEYYFNWYKKVLLNTTQLDDSDGSKEVIEANGGRLAELISNAEKGIAAITATINSKIYEIGLHTNIQIPNVNKEHADYELVQLAEDRFWEPNDPSVVFYTDTLEENNEAERNGMFQNEGIDNPEDSEKRTSLENSDSVKCRVSSELLDSEIWNAIGFNSADFILQGFKINNSNVPSGIIEKLVYEAVCLNPNLAMLMAHKIIGESKELTGSIVKEHCEKHILPFQRKMAKQIFFETNQDVFNPKFVLWEVRYEPKNGQEGIFCRGLNPLISGISKNLLPHLDTNTKNSFGKIVAQSLSGFHKQLVAQMPYVQLPPLEYETDADGIVVTDFYIDEQLNKILGSTGEAYEIACNPSQTLFTPVREGNITFTKLALVDCFGRENSIIDEVNATEIILSENISKANNTAGEAITLASRIIQPTRIKFNWLNKNKEVLVQDTGKLDHPVLGWLVPNYLDKMLMVYDASGNEIKMIRATDTKTIEEFIPVNDGIVSVSEIRKNRNDLKNKELLDIVSKLNINEVIERSKELNQKNTGATLTNNIVSLLYGQPIAVAQGELAIELLGNSIKNPAWNSQSGTNTGTIETSIEVAMGNPNIPDDGLIGYYLNEDYTELFKPRSKKGLSIKINSEPGKITVLLHANMGFYVETNGILPAKYMTLPQHSIEAMINDIDISFLLCPFIADQQNPDIPLPNAIAGNWNWVYKSDIEVWNNPKKVQEQDAQEPFAFKTQQLYEGWIKLNEVKQKAN